MNATCCISGRGAEQRKITITNQNHEPKKMEERMAKRRRKEDANKLTEVMYNRVGAIQ
jgi:hypothetical protein